MKFFIFGLGAVGYSFLEKLKENGLFVPNDFYCVEQNIQRKQLFIDLGGLEDHFIIDKITKDNYCKR